MRLLDKVTALLSAAKSRAKKKQLPFNLFPRKLHELPDDTVMNDGSTLGHLKGRIENTKKEIDKLASN